MDPRQYILPFGQMQSELLSQIAMLRAVDLGLSVGRSRGVIELLERLVLLGNDLSEIDGEVHVKAQGMAIAARIQRRHTVDVRTVRNWRRDAEQIGVLRTDMNSQSYGGNAWNIYHIDVRQIREKVAGNGRKRPEMVSAPGPEMVSVPLHSKTQSKTTPPLDPRQANVSGATNSPDDPAQQWSVVVSDLFSFGMKAAAKAVSAARSRGSSVDEVRAIIELWKRRQARQTGDTIGFLYNWVIGTHEPPWESMPCSESARASPSNDYEARRKKARDKMDMELRWRLRKENYSHEAIEERARAELDAFDAKHPPIAADVDIHHPKTRSGFRPVRNFFMDRQNLLLQQAEAET